MLIRSLCRRLVSLVAPLVVAAPVHAALVADVIDAADGEDLFDFVGEIRYERTLRRAKITREYGCDPNPATNPARFMGDLETCGDAGPAGRLLHVKELRYTRITHELKPRFRFGLWHDLVVSVTAPIDSACDTPIIGNAKHSNKAMQAIV